jgi:hypothetical protein
MNIFSDIYHAIFGMSDADRAERVLEAYADLDRLTPEERENLQAELDLTDDQSAALRVTLGTSLEVDEDGEVGTSLARRVATADAGRITSADRRILRDAGFSSEFVDALAGSNGNAALERRAQWLGENAVTRAFRSDCDETERRTRLLELAAMGSAGRGVLEYLHEIVRGEDGDDYTPAVRAAALGALLSVVDATSETSDDDEAMEVIEDMERPEEIGEGLAVIYEDLPPEMQRLIRSAVRRELASL